MHTNKNTNVISYSSDMKKIRENIMYICIEILVRVRAMYIWRHLVISIKHLI